MLFRSRSDTFLGEWSQFVFGTLGIEGRTEIGGGIQKRAIEIKKYQRHKVQFDRMKCMK